MLHYQDQVLNYAALPTQEDSLSQLKNFIIYIRTTRLNERQENRLQRIAKNKEENRVIKPAKIVHPKKHHRLLHHLSDEVHDARQSLFISQGCYREPERVFRHH